MSDARQDSRITRAIGLLKKLTNKRYRDSYIQSHTRRFLAQQMRAFRGDRSQAEMGEWLDKPQSVVSRLEDPTYGKWTLTSLFEIAERLDKAVIVRFVDPKTFVEFATNVSESAQQPASFTNKSISDARDAFKGLIPGVAQSRHILLQYVQTASLIDSFKIGFSANPDKHFDLITLDNFEAPTTQNIQVVTSQSAVASDVH